MNPTSFKSKKEFIEFWSNKFQGTNAKDFPKEFIETFPKRKDYKEFEKENDNHKNFDPETETYMINDRFSISIGDDEDDDISIDDWVDFYDSCWTW